MAIRGLTGTLVNDLLSVIFPKVCEVCGRSLVDGEEVMCLHCNADMPRTHYHTDPFNNMHQRLASDAHIDRAAAWFHYTRTSPYTKLIRRAKYNSRPDLSRTMGRLYAREILPSRFFDGIDILLPVPMHCIKELKRGYNQAHEIALGINDVTGIPVSDNLTARRSHKTQTQRGTYQRYLNVKDLFTARYTDELCGRHLLVIDDVMTSGSTMRACCHALRIACPDSTISVLTLASARLQ